MHLPAVGEARETDLSDIGAGKPIFDQGANRIAVAQSLVRVAHVEMGVERDQPDAGKRQPKSEHARTGHGIIAADQQRQLVQRRTELNRIADRPGRLLDRQTGDLDIAAIGDAR